MLQKRVITATLGVAVVVLALLLGTTTWQVLVFIAAVWAMIEFASLAHQRFYAVMSICAYLVIAYAVFSRSPVGTHFLVVVLAVFLAIPVLLQNRVSVQQSAFVLAGALYIGLGAKSLTEMHALPNGTLWLFVYLLSVWSTDTAAYFVGRSVGGRKLLPAISPNKTVSGSLGGLVAAIIIPTIVGVIAISPHGWVKYVVVGFAASVVGQIGDLIESAYKRTSGVKDSGHLLPGHGGMLDRTDSLLFAAPIVLWLMTSLR
ncbi:phosphatidate cytidylyltransferase [Alicyclobacillus mengziensis]|uniref:Phosphatidate cytidylyltransferase n=1 Tax=Alicyclobacillus mengziensis TaxID=2931921 RepID=A0A9X7VU43_9BACL|nr:phosphatidate cytidylyltransferase [Alicyclobacillus mengziensis]QSO45369.1 phosphatidate cytidylyltransferase [Alicyclobacillus mengziensis]